METDFRFKRILRETQLFKEAFPNYDITYKDFKIVIIKPNFKCIIKLPGDWPFKPATVMVNYNNYAYYQPKILDWNPIMDIRTIFYDVLNAKENGLYKNFERIQDKNSKLDEDPIPQVNLNIELERNNDTISSDHIEILRIKYPNVKITYCSIMKLQIISLGDLKIIISSSEIVVYENENDWPKYMIPDHSNNIFDIVDNVFNTKNTNQVADPTDYILKCKHSLNKFFDHIDYNEHHQTFLVSSLKYLIIIGINISSQYLAPMVMVYSKGCILSMSYDFSYWDPNILGDIILEAIHNYEKL